jgi:hypothetical protein
MTLSVTKISSAAVDEKCVKGWWNDTDREKFEVLGEKFVPVPLFSQNIPHDLTGE